MNEPLADGEHQKVGQKGIIRNGQDLVYNVLSVSRTEESYCQSIKFPEDFFDETVLGLEELRFENPTCIKLILKMFV